MLLTQEQIATSAHMLWSGRAALRAKNTRIEDVVYNRHQLLIPPKMTKRIESVYSGVAAEKLHRGDTALADQGGPLVTVATTGSSTTAEKRQERAQSWLQAYLRLLSQKQVSRSIARNIRLDLLMYSAACVRIQPRWEAWAAAAEAPEFELPEGTLTIEQMLEAAQDHLELCDEVEKENEALHRDLFPIHTEHVPWSAIHVADEDDDGPIETYEVRSMPVRQVLRTFQKPSGGGPAATSLLLAVGEDWKWKLSMENLVTVVIRCDREHMQVMISDLVLDNDSGVSGNGTVQKYGAGQQQVIWEGEHNLGQVPYAFFYGRMTSAALDVHRYYGFLDPIIPLVKALDNLLTQRASSVRMVAWPGMVETRPATLAMTAATTAGGSFVLDEGGINTLAPGSKIEAVNWVSSEGYRLLDQYEQSLKLQIDLHTLGPASYGAHGADSGYLYAEMQAAGEATLAVFESGLSEGYERLCHLVLLNAAVLIEAGLGDIPIRYVGAEGAQWVTMNADLADIKWEITVRVRSKPVGGEFALVQTLSALVDRGWETDEGAMARLGKPYPQRVVIERMKEKLLQGPGILQLIEQMVQQGVQVALKNQLAPNMPGQPILSPALAGVIGGSQDPGAVPSQVRLPSQGPPGTGIPGAPNMGMQAGLMPTPTPAAGGLGNVNANNSYMPSLGGHHPGGTPAGQAQAAPGGVNRNSALAGAFGS